METLADFNLDRKYHPRKENVVVDASSRKTVVVAALIALEWKLWEVVGAAGVEYRKERTHYKSHCSTNNYATHSRGAR